MKRNLLFSYKGIKNSSIGAISSVVEHYLDTVVATGSNPVSPIKTIDDLGYYPQKIISFFRLFKKMKLNQII